MVITYKINTVEWENFVNHSKDSRYQEERRKRNDNKYEYCRVALKLLVVFVIENNSLQRNPIARHRVSRTARSLQRRRRRAISRQWGGRGDCCGGCLRWRWKTAFRTLHALEQHGQRGLLLEPLRLLAALSALCVARAAAGRPLQQRQRRTPAAGRVSPASRGHRRDATRRRR